ncbi:MULTISPECIES: hypothetical protein [unclassified Mesorhizobium]|uniref:hypothetical protein n=3 Tax=Mesorhizobium TaxID=68287 RepID=UPI001FDEABF9|nr:MULTISPECIES: hypothetical protein [unclassified Mesorhizobium]
MIVGEDGSKHPDNAILRNGEVEWMLGDSLVVIGAHRQRLAADYRHPFGIGGAHDVADGGGVRRFGRPKSDGKIDGHCEAPDMKTPPAEVAGGAGNERTLSIVSGLSSRNRPAAPHSAKAASLGIGGRAGEHRGKLEEEPASVKARPVPVIGPTRSPIVRKNRSL